MRDTKFIRLAYKYSFKSKHNKATMAAVLVVANKPIAIGVNRIATHPKQLGRFDGRPSRSIHAELAAMLGNHKHCLVGSTLYVVRRMHNGDLGTAKPCCVCECLMRLFGIAKVVYSMGGTVDNPETESYCLD